MNFKNFSFILALLSFELKVLSNPINDNTSEKESDAVANLNSEVPVEELNALEISNSEDEFTIVNVVDSSLEDVDNDSDSESDTELEATEVPTDSIKDNEVISDLPCNDIQTCIGWMKENKEVLTTYGYGLPDEVFDYLLLQSQDEKNVENLQKNFDAIDYGMKVDVNGRKMSVNIKGEEHNTTIVLLPGLGISSPVLIYKSLTDILANDYKVVTIEPFGYGVSDLTDEERTAENIVSEIHECLQKLGIDQFYFMGHSLGGIYSIIYDNTFEDEVLGFIGLDNTPSNYDNYNAITYPEDVYIFAKIFDKYHLWGLLPESTIKELTGLDQEEQYQSFSEKELEELVSINSYRYNNPTFLDENDRAKDSVASTKGLYFHCPLLMFTASETQKYVTNWDVLHDNMIINNPNKEIIDKSDIIPLNNTAHAFIHVQNKEYISDEIRLWIN